jgi:hypothetical protein
MVHAHLGQDPGHRQGVLDIGLAGKTQLTLMGRRREVAGATDIADVGIVEITGEQLTQLAD